MPDVERWDFFVSICDDFKNGFAYMLPFALAHAPLYVMKSGSFAAWTPPQMGAGS